MSARFSTHRTLRPPLVVPRKDNIKVNINSSACDDRGTAFRHTSQRSLPPQVLKSPAHKTQHKPGPLHCRAVRIARPRWSFKSVDNLRICPQALSVCVSSWCRQWHSQRRRSKRTRARYAVSRRDCRGVRVHFFRGHVRVRS